MMHRMRKLFVMVFAVLAALLLSLTASAVCTEHDMDEGVVTTEPTCTTIGIITYTCRNEGCGYSYTEKIGNLGHRFVNGVCTVCGAVDESYVPETEPETQPETAAEESETAPVTILNTARPLSAPSQETETAVSFNVVAAGAQTGDTGTPLLWGLLLLSTLTAAALLHRKPSAQ
ncbi:MAG: hypothetical protein VB055_09045 [Oscillospiraceae bacterium]|nr:hypothetical protein [Oscillospiraceae bacterium]